jgi:hypothetical protein
VQHLRDSNVKRPQKFEKIFHLLWHYLKFQNEFMRSLFLPKSQPKITEISALEVY